MSITRRVTFRLYPSKTQNERLHNWRKLHKLLYNACVSQRSTDYKQFGKSINYFDQQNCLPEFKECWIEFKELGSHALQATVKRVDFAFQRFFKLKLGYPKFKSARRYKGWTYPCKAGWKACTEGKNGYLKLTNLGNIQMRGQARDWGTPKTCTILFKQGKWYASITVDCVLTRTQADTGAVGLDFGTHHAVAFSDGTIIDNPRFIKQSQDKVNQLAKKSRRKRAPNYKKRIRPSCRWEKANQAVSRIQLKVARQRQDWQHKVASDIVSGNSFVATEQLNLKNLTKKAKKGSKRKRQKTGLNRNLLDVGIGNLKSLIKYKVNEVGGIYIEIPTRKVAPSQTCPGCGSRRKKDLSERIHTCDCGIKSLDRDVAAAQVMLNYARGKELTSSDVESPSSILCGSMRQLGAKKRQKLVPNL
ncbi:transposase [Pleurocapsa sp. CCALA 161]|uniref:RNA-guided endonuclease InsQ/TnpB family protein n=1 Tax=Pleurocapsa sp. CCALA 161 TaxID=2107688 RepID=UPI000D071315|nr:RNA-guided endonuclease TnpB family protein [Pleurocapsa sp. CCALA 161]PSB10647.1 transposase [Pleurocapsa sp. CCALA 161]